MDVTRYTELMIFFNLFFLFFDSITCVLYYILYYNICYVFYPNIFLLLEKSPTYFAFPSLAAASVTSEFWFISTLCIVWKLLLKWEKTTLKLLTVFTGARKTVIQNGCRQYYLLSKSWNQWVSFLGAVTLILPSRHLPSLI